MLNIFNKNIIVYYDGHNYIAIHNHTIYSSELQSYNHSRVWIDSHINNIIIVTEDSTATPGCTLNTCWNSCSYIPTHWHTCTRHCTSGTYRHTDSCSLTRRTETRSGHPNDQFEHATFTKGIVSASLTTMADMLGDCTIEVRHKGHRVLVVLVFNSVSIQDWHMACPFGQKHDTTDIKVRHIGHSKAWRICREMATISVVSGSIGKMEAADTTDGAAAITSGVDAAAATIVSVMLAVDDSATPTEVVAVTTTDVITTTLYLPLLQ